MRKEFWKGRKVFLTGHTGFKGSWLCLWLQRLGADLTGYSLPPPTTPSLFEMADVGAGMKTVVGDIRDLDRLGSVLSAARPEIIFHLAAQSVVRASYEDPLETYTTNVIGTANLFEALRSMGHRCSVVNVTSDKCYENREWVWGYRESDPLGGRDPYSNSKACAELVTAAYRDSFFRNGRPGGKGVSVATARAGNVVGGGDWTPYQLIPDVMIAFLAGKPVTIRSPRSIRPWQFVLESLNGYMTLAEHLAAEGGDCASAWNFGPREDDARPVSWIVGRLAGLWGDGAGWIIDEDAGFHEAGYLKLDSSKARDLLGWRPAIGISKGLEWVVEWYRGMSVGGDMKDLTLEQIGRFERILESNDEPAVCGDKPGETR